MAATSLLGLAESGQHSSSSVPIPPCNELRFTNSDLLLDCQYNLKPMDQESIQTGRGRVFPLILIVLFLKTTTTYLTT